MLKLIKYELLEERVLKGILILLGILWLMISGPLLTPFLEADAAGSAILAVVLAFSLVLYLALLMFFSVIISLTWELLEGKRSYLLFTLPQPVSKIMLAKLLSTLPLWVMTVAFMLSFIFSLEPARLEQLFSATLILKWTVIFYTFTMVIFSLGVLLRKILPTQYHKWYQRKYRWMRVTGGFVFLWPSLAWLFFYRPFSSAEILLLIGLSTGLFFVSAHLLENELEVWE